jgi:hypothetical protein
LAYCNVTLIAIGSLEGDHPDVPSLRLENKRITQFPIFCLFLLNANLLMPVTDLILSRPGMDRANFAVGLAQTLLGGSAMRNLISRLGATTASVLPLIGVQAVCAQDESLSLGEHWDTVNPNMSPEEYRSAYHHNRHLLRDNAESYSVEALRSAGVSETGIQVMGVATGLAANGDARVYLTRRGSKGLTLEFRDLTNGDRSALLGIHLQW